MIYIYIYIYIYIIDGLGQKNLIPLSSWSKFFGRIKVKRRIKRMLTYLKNSFPEYKDFFVLEKILSYCEEFNK